MIHPYWIGIVFSFGKTKWYSETMQHYGGSREEGSEKVDLQIQFVHGLEQGTSYNDEMY